MSTAESTKFPFKKFTILEPPSKANHEWEKVMAWVREEYGLVFDQRIPADLPEKERGELIKTKGGNVLYFPFHSRDVDFHFRELQLIETTPALTISPVIISVRGGSMTSAGVNSRLSTMLLQGDLTTTTKDQIHVLSDPEYKQHPGDTRSKLDTMFKIMSKRYDLYQESRPTKEDLPSYRQAQEEKIDR